MVFYISVLHIDETGASTTIGERSMCCDESPSHIFSLRTQKYSTDRVPSDKLSLHLLFNLAKTFIREAAKL